jgi:uncharacterized membrane protein YgaE (UPF0421/DUF939 family)
MRFVSSLRTPARSPILQVLKTAVAASAAWVVSMALLGQPLPIFAAIAALLVVQPSVNQSLSKGLERSVGVIAGVVVAVVIGQAFGTGTWVVLAVIIVAVLVAWLLKLGPGTASQIPISAMLVLAIGAHTPGYAIDRILETIIGAALGLIINVAIVPPVLLRPAHLAVARLLEELATMLDELAIALTVPQNSAQLNRLLERARELRPLSDAAAEALGEGADSLTLNPRRSNLRRVLERDDVLFARLSVLVTRVIGMTRAIRDRYDDSLATDSTVASIAVELTRAAHDLRLLGRDAEGTAPETISTETAQIPTLTAPLRIMQPHPEHWILVGSLMEDIRRVREEIIGSEDS